MVPHMLKHLQTLGPQGKIASPRSHHAVSFGRAAVSNEVPAKTSIKKGWRMPFKYDALTSTVMASRTAAALVEISS